MATRPTSTTAPSCPPPTTTAPRSARSSPTSTARRTYATCNRNAGKSRVPWLTGTVSWSYFTAVQYILGIRPEIDGLRIDPCIPSEVAGLRDAARLPRQEASRSRCRTPHGKSKGITSLNVNGKRIQGNLVPLSEIKDSCVIEAVIDGTATAAPAAQLAGAAAGK